MCLWPVNEFGRQNIVDIRVPCQPNLGAHITLCTVDKECFKKLVQLSPCAVKRFSSDVTNHLSHELFAISLEIYCYSYEDLLLMKCRISVTLWGKMLTVIPYEIILLDKPCRRADECEVLKPYSSQIRFHDLTQESERTRIKTLWSYVNLCKVRNVGRYEVKLWYLCIMD